MIDNPSALIEIICNISLSLIKKNQKIVNKNASTCSLNVQLWSNADVWFIRNVTWKTWKRFYRERPSTRSCGHFVYKIQRVFGTMRFSFFSFLKWSNQNLFGGGAYLEVETVFGKYRPQMMSWWNCTPFFTSKKRRDPSASFSNVRMVYYYGMF